MSEFKDIIKEIAKENGINLTESNPFGLSDEEYAQQLAKSREEDQEDLINMYNSNIPYSNKLFKSSQKINNISKKPKIIDLNPEYSHFKKKLELKKREISDNDWPEEVNQLASELEDIKNELIKRSKNNPKLLELLGEEKEEKSSKKIFDKTTGYNVSEDENFYYELIKKKWPDVERSKTFDDFRNPENHRPWQVDFYVPSENMMIQINKNWRHGRRPYDPDDLDCKADVDWLKSQKGDYYKKVLYTWTELEPLKRKIAKELGYNYVEIFNMDEFIDWYKNPSLTYEEYKHPTRLKYDSDEYFTQKARHRDIYGNDSKWNE